MPIKIEAFKKVLMPAQHILKKLDPENKRSVMEVMADLQPLQDQYANLVVRNRPDLVPVDIKQTIFFSIFARNFSIQTFSIVARIFSILAFRSIPDCSLRF